MSVKEFRENESRVMFLLHEIVRAINREEDVRLRKHVRSWVVEIPDARSIRFKQVFPQIC